ncbi:MAG: leucine-rich repeat domain-containing protein [Oscillospiraceae bacterium]|nr:leucine-rich repeat domain-containing protein [Oscillospiraceae bacterium]
MNYRIEYLINTVYEFRDMDSEEMKAWREKYASDTGNLNMITFVEDFDISEEELLQMNQELIFPYDAEFIHKIYLPAAERFEQIGNPYAIFLPNGEIYDPVWWQNHSIEEWRDAGLTYDRMVEALRYGFEKTVFDYPEQDQMEEKLNDYAKLMGKEPVKVRDEFRMLTRDTLLEYNGKGGEVVFPDYVFDVSGDTLANERITSLTLPYNFSNTESIKLTTADGDRFFYRTSGLYALNRQYLLHAEGKEFCEIKVAKGNTNFKVVDGVLYSYDMKTLILYPQGKPETSFVVPDSVRVIGESAFYGAKHLTEVTIPDTVELIGSCAFVSSGVENVTMPSRFMEGKETIGWIFYGTPFAAKEEAKANNPE